jgi:hypothetical protein
VGQGDALLLDPRLTRPGPLDAGQDLFLTAAVLFAGTGQVKLLGFDDGLLGPGSGDLLAHADVTSMTRFRVNRPKL